MIAAAKAASRSEKLNWRAAGLLLGAVWPWTVFVMMPLNKKIIAQVHTHWLLRLRRCLLVWQGHFIHK
jgi:hypothetical protein